MTAGKSRIFATAGARLSHRRRWEGHRGHVPIRNAESRLTLLTYRISSGEIDAAGERRLLFD